LLGKHMAAADIGRVGLRNGAARKGVPGKSCSGSGDAEKKEDGCGPLPKHAIPALQEKSEHEGRGDGREGGKAPGLVLRG